MATQFSLALGLMAAFGGICSVADAADMTSHRAVRLLDFSQSQTKSAEQERGAQVLGFGLSPPASSAEAELVATEMTTEFDALRSPQARVRSIVLGPQGPFANASFVRVPGWMRGGANASPVQFSNLVPMELPSIGRCAPRGYIRSAIMGRSAEARRAQLFPEVQRAACEAGLPVGLMDAVIMQESRYNPGALSPVGAYGLGQLMPGTARDLGVNRFDLRANLAGAARYLRSQLDEFGQVHLALAAYNAGPGRVRKTGRVPRITETQNYVRNILVNWRQLEREQWTR